MAVKVVIVRLYTSKINPKYHLNKTNRASQRRVKRPRTQLARLRKKFERGNKNLENSNS